MIVIKSYTDLEQSKTLSKILPLESADMYWWFSGKRYYIEAMDDGDFNEEEGHIRAWSLAALLTFLKDYTLQKAGKDVFIICENEKTVIGTENYENPVDACYEMIIKLNELNLL